MIKKNLLLLLLLLVMGCANDSSSSSDAIDDCIEQDSVPTTVVFGGDTVNIQQQTPITDAKTVKGIQDRASKSEVKDDKCCISTENIQPCCCEEIAKKYKSLLQKNDFDAAINLKAEIPFLKDA